MDSNYEWQKFQAYERVQARLQQAERQRLIKLGSNGRLPITFESIAKIKTSLFVIMKILRREGLRVRSAYDVVEKRERPI